MATMELYKVRMESEDETKAFYPHTSTDVVFDENGNSVEKLLDDIYDGTKQVGDSAKLGGKSGDEYALQTSLDSTNVSVTNIVNGTTKVAKAISADSATSATKATQDGNGKVISSTYATQSSLNITNTNVSNIINGTTTVSKATSATKATQDGSGNTITSTYVNLSGSQTISGAKTFSGNAVMKTGTDYTTSRARNIALQTTTPTSISNGAIVGVYE